MPRSNVRGHVRRTKSGKTTRVRPHVRITEAEWSRKPKSLIRTVKGQREMKMTTPSGKSEFLPVDVQYEQDFLPQVEEVEGDFYHLAYHGDIPERLDYNRAIGRAKYLSGKGYGVRFKELDGYWYLYLKRPE